MSGEYSTNRSQVGISRKLVENLSTKQQRSGPRLETTPKQIGNRGEEQRECNQGPAAFVNLNIVPRLANLSRKTLPYAFKLAISRWRKQLIK